jgi:hypothetical protein
MPARKPDPAPPFNVVRGSHVEFGARDLDRARRAARVGKVTI